MEIKRMKLSNRRAVGVVFKGIKNVKNINQKFKQIKASEVEQYKEQPQGKIQQTVNIQTSKPQSNQPKPPKPADVKEPKKEKLEAPPPPDSKDTQYCKHCGAEIDANFTYCSKNGEKLN